MNIQRESIDEANHNHEESLENAKESHDKELGLMGLILKIITHPEYLALSDKNKSEILTSMFKTIKNQYKQNFGK